MFANKGDAFIGYRGMKRIQYKLLVLMTLSTTTTTKIATLATTKNFNKTIFHFSHAFVAPHSPLCVLSLVLYLQTVCGVYSRFLVASVVYFPVAYFIILLVMLVVNTLCLSLSLSIACISNGLNQNNMLACCT